MTTIFYITCILMFLGGQALQLFWVKIPSVKKRAKAANAKYSFSDYWADEWNLIIGSFVLCMLLIIGLDEILNLKPQVLDVCKWFFGIMGYMGQSIVLSKLSKYEGKLNEIVDIKTDIADKKL